MRDQRLCVDEGRRRRVAPGARDLVYLAGAGVERHDAHRKAPPQASSDIKVFAGEETDLLVQAPEYASSSR